MTHRSATEREQEEPSAGLPAAPPAAASIFGGRLPLAERFAAVLADTGVSHGLIGPREVPRLWDRHILNCAVAHEAFPESTTVIDVGSGAGLPGLALAVARPDLQIHLVEPMLRRTNWLNATVESLGLDNCTVHRGRAEEFRGRLSAPYATARAVARIDKLARWTFPMLETDGVLVALKGDQAAQELAEEREVLAKLGMVHADIRTYGAGLLEVPTVTMELTIGANTQGVSRVPRKAKKRPSARSKKAGDAVRETRRTRHTES
ncbi:16S rRNA (guanine(527)-N(7))-methyltransferase RsmG [Knoellia sp. p5-6-4]|uniref:16S rRNA (guanine(527)-N(7))-methyltransferase RsmG n=1 Tax=unclassified Knoellia TaxID=2618719 RepID=UPI0023D984F4|nr:16S rRNA (guanine(527)-N(7))-methyltransferase RsmG [Knoellia sp. p5-6-4]MDF2145104.1 16S rRNA (guanine(527)-N(7))-methyltransferase RsmG [Knoellia sp. p5-6-4]